MTATATPTAKLPDHIHACVDPKALRRIPRMFDAGNQSILAELLQNARRAGASRLHATFEQDPDNPEYGTINIEDDGCGIANPGILLAFGANDWDSATTRDEDAAGMGFAALSSHSSTLWSRTENGPGWKASLEPAHFQGDKDASILPAADAPTPHGTRVQVRRLISFDVFRLDLEHASRHYPLPVTLKRADDPKTPARTMEQQDFLANCVYRKAAGGATIGVTHDHYPVRTHAAFNFHGHTLDAELPTLTTLDGRHWYAHVDVHRATHLHLVLPQRSGVVKNDAFKALQHQVKAVLYEAIAQDPLALLPFSQYLEARELAPQKPTPGLFPWDPEAADQAKPYRRSLTTDIPDGAFIVDLPYTGASAPQEQTLARAFTLANEYNLAFRADKRFQGYAFYDNLPRLTRIQAIATADGTPYHLRDLACEDEDSPSLIPEGPAPDNFRPDTLSLALTFKTHGNDSHRSLCTDIVAAGPMPEYTEPPDTWLITRTSQLAAHQVADYLVACYLENDCSHSADAWHEEYRGFHDEALHDATTVLHGTHEANRAQTEAILRRHLPWLFNSRETFILETSQDGLGLTSVSIHKGDPV